TAIGSCFCSRFSEGTDWSPYGCSTGFRGTRYRASDRSRELSRISPNAVSVRQPAGAFCRLLLRRLHSGRKALVVWSSPLSGVGDYVHPRGDLPFPLSPVTGAFA